MQSLQTDVLVIGAGAAGLRAALAAARAGVDVTLVVKGLFKRTGSTGMAIAENAGFAVPVTDDTAGREGFLRDILHNGRGVTASNLAEIVVDEAWSAWRSLSELGVPFLQDAEGAYVRRQGCFATEHRNFVVPDHARPIAAALQRAIGALGTVRILERVMIVDLICDRAECCGAVGLRAEGGVVAISAKAVVLATGGAARISPQTLAPPEVTGDGYALAMRAGAKLVNMEFIQIGLGIVPTWSILNSWVWAGRPRVINDADEDILTPGLPAGVSVDEALARKARHFPFTSEDAAKWIDLAVANVRRTGRSVYLDLRPVAAAAKQSDDATLRKMWPFTQELVERKGRRIEEPLEIAHFVQAFNGGALIDASAETTVSALYAAGEASGGIYGADRPGGTMLMACQVFGQRAGVSAATFAKQHPGKRLSAGDLEKAANPYRSTTEGKRKYSATELAAVLQRAVQAHLFLARNERGLNTLRDLVAQLRTDTDSAASSKAWKLLELRNLLDVTDAVVTAALLRKESRGSHFRDDFPTHDETLASPVTVWCESGQMRSARLEGGDLICRS